MVQLNRTYYSLLKFTSKIFKIVSPSQIPANYANYANSAQFAPTVREFRKICTIRLTYSTLCFRHLPQQRTPRNSSKLRKFRAIRPHSLRIPQNSQILLTYYTLCFSHVSRQRTLQNSSELRKFRAICPHSPRITQNLHILLHYTLRFRCLTSGKELKFPANQAKLAQFAQLPCELHEFRAFRSKLIHI